MKDMNFWGAYRINSPPPSEPKEKVAFVKAHPTVAKVMFLTTGILLVCVVLWLLFPGLTMLGGFVASTVGISNLGNSESDTNAAKWVIGIITSVASNVILFGGLYVGDKLESHFTD